MKVYSSKLSNELFSTTEEKEVKRFVCEEIYKIDPTIQESPYSQQLLSNIQNSNILNLSIRQYLEKQLLSNSNRTVPQVGIPLIVKIIQGQRFSLKFNLYINILKGRISM